MSASSFLFSDVTSVSAVSLFCAEASDFTAADSDAFAGPVASSDFTDVDSTAVSDAGPLLSALFAHPATPSAKHTAIVIAHIFFFIAALLISFSGSGHPGYKDDSVICEDHSAAWTVVSKAAFPRFPACLLKQPEQSHSLFRQKDRQPADRFSFLPVHTESAFLSPFCSVLIMM